ncbi:MAG TPA: hypothetical protein VN922_07050 [Bacteroidia bacterium]|nr:hypothetical protein [Bacteroidia bacterium]
MKKLIFIIVLLLPVVLFAQQDSAVHTFKIQKSVTYALINGVSLGTTNKVALLKSDTIKVSGPSSYTINGFTMSILYKWGECDTLKQPRPVESKNAKLTKRMAEYIKDIGLNCSYGAIVKFYNIRCTLPDGSSPALNDITLFVTPK